jgi:hypothetical protein
MIRFIFFSFLIKIIHYINEKLVKDKNFCGFIYDKYFKSKYDFLGDYIVCENLFDGNLSLTTKEYGKGKVYRFEKLGDKKKIRRDDLEEIILCHYKLVTAYLKINNSLFLYQMDMLPEWKKRNK